MTSFATLDLDAARREEELPDGIEVTLKGVTFVVPSELPLDVFDPFFTDDFDLGALLKVAFESDDDDPTLKVILDMLTANPKLPANAYRAVHTALETLLEPEGYAAFKSARPSVKDTARLVKGLFRMYGTSLGEAFASAESSASGGSTQKQTSSSTTESTPAEPGADETTKDDAPAPASSE